MRSPKGEAAQTSRRRERAAGSERNSPVVMRWEWSCLMWESDAHRLSKQSNCISCLASLLLELHCPFNIRLNGHMHLFCSSCRVRFRSLGANFSVNSNGPEMDEPELIQTNRSDPKLACPQVELVKWAVQVNSK